MQSDRHELLAVRLGSGRVYLVPRAVLENLVHAYPEEALQLIVSASTTRGPLDPLGLPLGGGQINSKLKANNVIPSQITKGSLSLRFGLRFTNCLSSSNVAKTCIINTIKLNIKKTTNGSFRASGESLSKKPFKFQTTPTFKSKKATLGK